MIEYFTGNAYFIDRDKNNNRINARNVLTLLTSGNKKIRDDAENLIRNEIKTRREHVTRVEIINLINRYQDGLGLTLTNFNATYEDIINDIEILHEEFKKYKSTDEIFEKLKEKEIDFLPEADLITLDKHIYLNETLLNSIEPSFTL